MSSIAGRLGYPNRSPYATTKWGLIGFTKTLSMELGEFGIRVNAILPGAVAGPRLDRVYDARAKVGGQSIDEIKTRALANQSLKTSSIRATWRRWRCSWRRTPQNRSRAKRCRSTAIASRRPDGDWPR